MATTRIDSVLALSGFPPLVPHVPPNWPQGPSVGKIGLLWKYNNHELYHKFSPYTNYHDSLFASLLSNKQPFVYTYIDEAGNSLLDKIPSPFKTFADEIANINNDTINDVVRVGRFLVSSWGVQFLATQVTIQRLQPFDETRVYNPLSPILATVAPLTLGVGLPPIRHVEQGLLGLASSITSVVGINLQSSYQTPASTAGNGALSSYNSGQGKGLLRGADASKGYAQLQVAWPTSTNPSNSSPSGVSGLTSMVTAAVNQLFGSTPSQPKGTIFRADEKTYSLMAISPRSNGGQTWYANSKTVADKPPGSTSNSILNTINSIVSIVQNPTQIIGNALSGLFSSTGGAKGGTFVRKKLLSLPNGFVTFTITNGITGQSIKGRNTGYIIKDGDKYGRDVFSTNDIGSLENSDILVQFSYYATDGQNYDSKFDDANSNKVKDLISTLQSVIGKINGNGIIGQVQYTANTNTYSHLLSSGDLKSIGYDNLFNTIPRLPRPKNSYGVTGEYNTGASELPPTIDKSVNPNNNLRFATSFASDGLNQLPILNIKNGKIQIPHDPNLSVDYTNWTEYKPYKDDLIAFFFYDVVNQKFIPFRATIKGISEGNTAFWDELRFIGRPDQLYNYNGFSRTLAFSFNIVINSVTELLPAWKRIGYLASVVKPSNYTRSETVGNVFDRFMVPPMFMVTIGDLYKYQPMVIRSVTVNIPDDAIWETLNEFNSEEWSYLNGIIKNPNMQSIDNTGINGTNSTGVRYGQLPREIEINVEGALLEKERAQVGGNHYGHAPRKDNWENFLDSNGNITDDAFLVGDANTPYLPQPSFLHKTMIEAIPSTQPKVNK